MPGYLHVQISLIGEPHNNPTRVSEDIGKLIEDIRRSGVQTPIVLIRCGDKFKIKRGFRRVLAAKAAGLQFIPAVIESE